MALPDSPVICVDFDGVLHIKGVGDELYPNGPPVEGALSAIQELIRRGYRVVVSSVRARESRSGRVAIERWLCDHDFPQLTVTHLKPDAHLYIDDRGLRFEGPESWPDVIKWLDKHPVPDRWRLKP